MFVRCGRIETPIVKVKINLFMGDECLFLYIESKDERPYFYSVHLKRLITSALRVE